MRSALAWCSVFILGAGGMAQAKPAAPAQPAPKAPAKTWMDLAVGTEVVYSLVGEDAADMGGGSASSGNAPHELRTIGLGVAEDGRLRVVILDEALPKEGHDVPIVRAEFALLDPATGELVRAEAAADGLGAAWSPLALFPLPPLSQAEWKAKKPVQKTCWVPVSGEPQQVPLAFTFGTAKDGKKTVPTLTAVLAGKEPVAIQLVSIAGMVAMAEGRMPKLGFSDVEPVPASLTALRREFRLDPASGRIVSIQSTSTTLAASGKMKIAGTHTVRETKRRQVPAAGLAEYTKVVEEFCAIVQSRDDKAEKKARAEALQAAATKVELGPSVARLIDSLTRDGLPPGFPR